MDNEPMTKPHEESAPEPTTPLSPANPEGPITDNDRAHVHSIVKASLGRQLNRYFSDQSGRRGKRYIDFLLDHAVGMFIEGGTQADLSTLEASKERMRYVLGKVEDVYDVLFDAHSCIKICALNERDWNLIVAKAHNALDAFSKVGGGPATQPLHKQELVMRAKLLDMRALRDWCEELSVPVANRGRYGKISLDWRNVMPVLVGGEETAELEYKGRELLRCIWEIQDLAREVEHQTEEVQKQTEELQEMTKSALREGP
ncbi:hypothetical protein B0T25DRAFT_520390 [Lasiosphaeria hispida]|uniref:Uncharacterized protein n=1 Tax=Lasiosphaeria hispida TaxID=260671 RepID=A0AAJ0MA29_9PEZI|nr:hypothetical protein B0T25DRAFT_520390 [Lasiosphaeria hispida]